MTKRHQKITERTRTRNEMKQKEMRATDTLNELESTTKESRRQPERGTYVSRTYEIFPPKIVPLKH